MEPRGSACAAEREQQMIYSMLRKTVVFYMLTGIALGLIILSVSLLSKHEKNLRETTGKFEIIRTNTSKTKQASDDMARIMSRIDAALPSDYPSRSHRELMLFVLDDIKMNIRGSEITVTDFEEKDGGLTLPVNIKIYFGNNYALLASYIEYLQSLRFPYLAIKDIMLEKTADATPVKTSARADVIICKITGFLTMPSERRTETRRHG